MNPNQPTAPNQRTFSLNSEEFYHAVTPPPDPSRWGPGLPREPRVRDPEVIVETLEFDFRGLGDVLDTRL